MVRWNDSLAITIAVDLGGKASKQQKNKQRSSNALISKRVSSKFVNYTGSYMRIHVLLNLLNRKPLILSLFHNEFNKENVLLRREISIKVICETVKFSNCDFCYDFHDYEWIYIYIIQQHILCCSNRGQRGDKYGLITLKIAFWYFTYQLNGSKLFY